MEPPDPPRLLVVDDEDAILETMSFTFIDDYEVITTNDARRGLEILEEQAPIAVVLTDQRMPHMTGVEFLREVYERHPDTVRIMLTGAPSMASAIKAINSGEVFRFLEKPCSTDMLALTMELALQVRRLKLASWALLKKVREDKSSLAELERESKGITDVRRDSGGAILIEVQYPTSSAQKRHVALHVFSWCRPNPRCWRGQQVLPPQSPMLEQVKSYRWSNRLLRG